MFKICFENDYEYSKLSGNIYSTFYVQHDRKKFPDGEWCDFPVPVLMMWTDVLVSSILSRNDSEFILDFMDGPFVIACKIKDDRIEMRFLDQRRREVLEDEFSLHFMYFVRILYRTSKELIESIKKMNYKTVNDLEKLDLISNKLNTIFKNCL